jgi:DNA-binding NarL/FixJ family response regulator
LLFVTSKTVDTHLSHVYSKLGISSRRELGGALEVELANAQDSVSPSPA